MGLHSAAVGIPGVVSPKDPMIHSRRVRDIILHSGNQVLWPVEEN